MNLWHDDMRVPPEGWEWAKSNEEAKQLLSNNDVQAISMDHDMRPEHYTNLGVSMSGSGLDLVKWMIENDKVPPDITIHSWNPTGARRMAELLRSHGHFPVVERAESMT